MKQNLVWLGFLVFQNGVVSEIVFQHQLCSSPVEQQKQKWQAPRKCLSPVPCSGEGCHVLQTPSTSIFLMILQNLRWEKIQNMFPYFVSLLLQTGCCANSQPKFFCSKLCLMSEWQLEKSNFLPAQKLLQHLWQGNHYPLVHHAKDQGLGMARDTVRCNRTENCRNFASFSGHGKTEAALN